MLRLSNAQARRVALAAQGVGRFGRDRDVTMRGVQRVIDDVAQFQIDSVNVMVRAHLMPLFSRLGAYEPALLTRAGYLPDSRSAARPQRLFEYWGHAASLIDVRLYPALRFRMADARPWAFIKELVNAHPDAPDELLDVIRERGPSTPRDLDAAPAQKERGWWNWSSTKTLLEWLFHTGRIAVVRRNSAFERVFDVPERVLPRECFEAPPLGRAEAHVELARRAARALGVATASSLADYFRTAPAETRAAIAALEARGELIPVAVEGVPAPAWLWRDAARPRRIEASALISPFDSLAFDRGRLRTLFGVDYTIGLYTPKDQREHGYYVYLFVLDDAIVARADLKADRAAGALRVQSAWLEPGHDAGSVAAALAAELRRTADWLGLTDVAVSRVGDLIPALARALHRSAP